ncbi:hypothetical protein AUJ66_05550 [Candidatus Desantisbacteria bacterium CG1_02_38_46]|nr:MAG: hypothetical protein AUJ66_05550 [Candidatus Desantisbacteria bacterium CG1_02_38_46]
MKKEFSPEVKVGILISIAIVILFVFTFMIGKFHFFKKGYYIKVTFNFVEGLDVGAPVRLAGVKAGSVTDIRLSPEDNMVILTLWLNSAVLVRSDSKFYLNTLGFMGEKYIEIDPGTSSAFLKPGGFVRGEETRRLEEIIRQGQEIAEESGKIVKSVRKFTDKVSLQELELAISDFRSAINTLQENASTFLNNLNRAAGDIKDITSGSKENVQIAISKLKETLIKLEKTTTSLNAILDKVERGEGTVGVLLNDKQVANDIKEIVANFKVFSEDIKENPSWLIMGKPKKKK